ncbi:YceI family protein [Flavobacterium lipolyticum]|uniref:YceI family protein n=1 Tax=Flavobacterium lipolyticum TaxID=2893754 RepID=A0ABS8M3W3_9FLAO|nr:YceI family protein [Flavobacterium sp. F-126]MCC9019509.1 YceI family protein [Flavobacterium sp. F-126]
MNPKASITYLILIIIPLFLGCRGPIKEENIDNAGASTFSSEHGANEEYSIDTKKSVVTWKGSMLIGSDTNTGYVSISEGELIIKNGQLIDGTAEIDMNTIADKRHKSDNELVEHLKSSDFFDVQKFPTSTITAIKVTSINGKNKNVTGNLTIKGITNPVSFPAKIEIKDGIVQMNGKLVIDRTKWNVRYKSGKFFDLLPDQTMSDSIEFTVNIIAKN